MTVCPSLNLKLRILAFHKVMGIVALHVGTSNNNLFVVYIIEFFNCKLTTFSCYIFLRIFLENYVDIVSEDIHHTVVDSVEKQNFLFTLFLSIAALLTFLQPCNLREVLRHCFILESVYLERVKSSGWFTLIGISSLSSLQHFARSSIQPLKILLHLFVKVPLVDPIYSSCRNSRKWLKIDSRMFLLELTSHH